MNLIKEIEKEHSKAQCDNIVRYVGEDPKRFSDLVDAFLNGPYRITQRSAWPLSYCVEYHPELVKPHLKRILAYAMKSGVHVSVKRNTTRLLQFIVVPKSLQALVADLAFTLLQDNKETIAVRVFAMTVLSNLVTEIPELRNELVLLIEDQLPYAGPAFRSRGTKVLKELKRLAQRNG